MLELRRQTLGAGVPTGQHVQRQWRELCAECKEAAWCEQHQRKRCHMCGSCAVGVWIGDKEGGVAAAA